MIVLWCLFLVVSTSFTSVGKLTIDLLKAGYFIYICHFIFCLSAEAVLGGAFVQIKQYPYYVSHLITIKY